MSANPSSSHPLATIPSLNDFRFSFGHPTRIAGTGPPLHAGSNDPDSPHVRWDDPTWKIILAALKKHEHNNYYRDNNWENYAMFVCYGPPNNRTEICLNYDKKPLLAFQKLKDAEKNPIFVLKHVKDIPSPIAAARQRRFAHETSMHPSIRARSRENQRPVDNLTSLLNTIIPSTSGGGMPPPLAGVSFAVSIYPYVAEQEDELNVSVGDTFVIISRLYSWFVVQRDFTGAGTVGTDTSMWGWVPNGCCLEIGIPVASAIAEAMASAPFGSRAPILPHRIISSSSPGVVLMDYKMKGEEEVDLVMGDAVRIFKVHDHWSYAVKGTGDRGWVPSWFIGKPVQQTSATSNALMLDFEESN